MARRMASRLYLVVGVMPISAAIWIHDVHALAGYFFLNGGAISWQSKMQSCTADSSTEADFCMSVFLRQGGLANGFGNLCLILVHLLLAPLGYMRAMLLRQNGLKVRAISRNGSIFTGASARLTIELVQERQNWKDV